MRRASRGRLERPLSVSEVAESRLEVGVLWGCEGGVSLLGRGSAVAPSEVMPFGWAMVRDVWGLWKECLGVKLSSLVNGS